MSHNLDIFMSGKILGLNGLSALLKCILGPIFNIL